MIELKKQTQMDDSKMEDILKAWKSKSLNSKFMQRYKIEFDKSKDDRQDQSKKRQLKTGETQKSTPQQLPEPKFAKINEQIFCLYLYKCLVIFKFLSEAEKQFFKPKENELVKTFYSSSHYFEENIKFAIGNGTPCIYVGLENQLHTLKLEYRKQESQESQKYRQYNPIKSQERRVIPRLKGISFVRELRDEIEMPLIVAITNEKVIKYKLNSTKDEREKPLEEHYIQFESKDDRNTFSEINSIQILCENNIFLYLFGTKQGLQNEVNEKDEKVSRRYECLYLVKFNLENPTSIKPTLSLIDHVFETGIFNKSKIFQCGPSVFLISLFEEIIVVKYHFQRYVVWDNISLARSKTNEKRGQLILADKIVMVYTESSEIYAHNIFFSFKQSKLKYPRIDSFRGNANEDQILYDALVLEYQQGSFMKVLFYFKYHEVFTPNMEQIIQKDGKSQGENKPFILFIRCIQQNNPLAKLAELFRGKKTPQQISEFVQRFGIAEIDKIKCEWSVSEKSEKDIEGLLLEIKHNEYIQDQLTTILKSSPHDLKFLKRIQTKQIERYKNMLATKLLKQIEYSSGDKVGSTPAIESGGCYTKKEVEQIKQIIKWVMQSIMFKKKLIYSGKFLQFMQYDFIQIGKLKAASLKQQIKLLSCKGFEKRLVYFLNSFKYMILDKFQDIFEFLIENKTEDEVQKFFKDNFPFILPKFKEKVLVFKEKNKARERKFSFAEKLPLVFDQRNMEENKKKNDSDSQNEYPNLEENDNAKKSKNDLEIIRGNEEEKKTDIKEDEEEKKKQDCELWVNYFDRPSEIEKIETIQSFEKEIEAEIIKTYKKENGKKFYIQIKDSRAIQQFKIILQEFIKEEWFRNNKSKQHSIIESDIKTLQKKMKYFKRIGVFHLLIKFFYSKNPINYAKIDKVLLSFKKAGLIPESFQKNILARREIYQKIEEKRKIDVELPLLEHFLIQQETDYFDYLFLHYREMLLTDIKAVYDRILPGWFKEIFKIYLDSPKIQLTEIIKFLEFFEGNTNVDIRLDIFSCIKNLLRISDKANTSFFVDKLMELEVLNKEGNSHNGIDFLIDEAKIAFGYYFYNFFQIFSITSTYKQLISETFITNYDQCKIIKTILQKYCNGKYKLNLNNEARAQDEDEEEQERTLVRLEPSFGLDEIQFDIVNSPLDFFGILLYLIDTLRLLVPPEIVFDKFLELLNMRNDDQIVKFITQFRDCIGGENNDYSEPSNDSNDRAYSKNFSLLKAFYSESNFTIQERLIDNVLIWVRKMYNNSGFSYTGKMLFNIIDQTFSMIDQLNIESPELIREKSFLKMLKSIKQIQSSLLKYVLDRRFQNFQGNYLEENSSLLNKIPAFIFMMRILKEIPKENFDEQDPEYGKEQNYKQIKESKDELEKIRREKIDLFDDIYKQFLLASKYKQTQSEESGISRFYVELAMRLIEDKQFVYCKQVLIDKCISKDPFYQFLALIQPSQKGPSEEQFIKFIKKFVTLTNTTAAEFEKFLSLQYSICKFQGSKQQQFNYQADSAHFILEQDKSSKQLEAQPKDLTDTKRKSKIYNNQLIRDEQKRNSGLFKVTSSISNQVKPYTFSNAIFLTLIETNRVEEAYYFLVRNKILSVNTASELGFHKNQTKSHALISIYLKCLRGFLCEQFYPTFSFYQKKHQILLNEYERKDIIKDINIALSRMKEMISEQMLVSTKNEQDSELKKSFVKSLSQHHDELKKLYQAFMASIYLDPIIKLNESETKEGIVGSEGLNRLIMTHQIQANDPVFPISPRFQSLKQSMKHQAGSYFAPKDLKNDLTSGQESQLEKEKKRIKENPKFVQLEKQINRQVKQSKLLSQQYGQDDTQLPKANSQARERNMKKYQELRQKQRKEIDSVKESYKSQTSSRVQQILEEMKIRKSKIIEKSDGRSKYSKVEIDESEGQRSRKNSFQQHGFPQQESDLMSPPYLDIQIPREKSESMTSNEIDQSKKYEVKVRGIDGNIKNLFMPVTISKEEKESSSRVSLQSREPMNIGDISKINKMSNVRSEMGSQGLIGATASRLPAKATIQEIKKLFAERQPQCVKYVEKLEIVKNNVQIGLQISKNIYSSVNSFEMFVKYVGFLLENYPSYKEVLEEKAYKIALQAMGIECKINLKELFPIDLFTKVSESSIKEYYKKAYQIVRPNLMKILARPETNIHGLAILFRFGFGSQNTYYYRVYEDYIKTLLKDYSDTTCDDRKLFLLAEKLRALYGNINTQNRQTKFQQLLREVGNEAKRKCLVKEILKILQRRNEMLTGEKQSDLMEVLIKLSR